MENKIDDFYFPVNVLKDEDFAPVDVLVLKDYYRNCFLQLLDSVHYIIRYNFYLNNRWEKMRQKNCS